MVIQSPEALQRCLLMLTRPLTHRRQPNPPCPRHPRKGSKLLVIKVNKVLRMIILDREYIIIVGFYRLRYLTTSFSNSDTAKRETSPNLDHNTMTTLPEKTSSDDTTNAHKIKSSNSGMIIGIVVGLLAALVFCVINVIICRRKKKSNETKDKHGSKGDIITLI